MAIVLKPTEEAAEAAVDAPDLKVSGAKDLGFRDPFSEITRKIRGRLIFASAFAILARVYQLKVTHTPWLDFEIPANAPQFLIGLVSAAVAYLFFVFILYAYMDLKRWNVRAQIYLLQAALNTYHMARQHVGSIKVMLEMPTLRPDQVEALEKLIPTATRELEDGEAKLLRLRGAVGALSRVQWFRVIVVELGVPLLLAAIGIWKTGPEILPFLQAIFR